MSCRITPLLVSLIFISLGKRSTLGFQVISIVARSSVPSMEVVTTAAYSCIQSSLKAVTAVNLKPEPDIGHEIPQIDTIPNCRMKNLGPKEQDATENNREQVYTFWLTAEVNGSLIKGFRQQVEKDASKKANFPGFRKGQIPPYAQSKMTTFAIQEGIIKTCEEAVKAYGLKALPGSDGSVEVHEDVQEMTKIYKIGENLPFTATFCATFNTEKLVKTGE